MTLFRGFFSPSIFRSKPDLGDVKGLEGVEDGDHDLVLDLVGAFDDDGEVGIDVFEGLELVLELGDGNDFVIQGDLPPAAFGPSCTA